jgi:hypothetical protein
MEDFDQINPKRNKNHLYFTFGPELLMYKTSHEFSGAYNNFNIDDSVIYRGVNLGLGYRLQLGSRMATMSMISANYLAQKDRQIKKAATDFPYPVFDSIENHLVYGAHISQSLEFKLFTRSYITVAPFIQVGIGVGLAESEIDYYYDDTVNKEHYRVTIDEDLAFQTVAIGVSLMALNGLTSIIKVQKNTITIGTREAKGNYQIAGGETVEVASSDSVSANRDDYSLVIQFGYIF